MNNARTRQDIFPGPQYLPFSSNPNPADDPESQHRQEHSRDYPQAPSIAPGRTILLVDDDPDIRALARTFLEHTGFHVLSSADPDRAAQIFLSSSHIDLLITDRHMPGRSGIDLAMQLKEIRPDLPVLMISGAQLEPDLHEQFTRRGWSFLPKPFSLPSLLTAVHRILPSPFPEAIDAV